MTTDETLAKAAWDGLTQSHAPWDEMSALLRARLVEFAQRVREAVEQKPA